MPLARKKVAKPVRFFFADDSRQTNPTRSRMGPLVAIGGVALASDVVKTVEQSVNEACQKAGFPPGEEFKWSPGRELWMRKNLVDDKRRQFYIEVFRIIEEHKALLTVVIEDTSCKCATDAPSPEIDVTRLYLERVHGQLNRSACDGIVIVDRPGGGRAAEDKFLLSCLETIQERTEYLNPERFAINVLSSPSKFVRLLQVADVVVGCTLSAVSGEKRNAPQTLAHFCGLFESDGIRTGGIGVKNHPDLKYVNLYHWVLGDDIYRRYTGMWALPKQGHIYCDNDGVEVQKGA